MARPREIATLQGQLEFHPTSAFDRLAGADFGSLPAARPHGSSSNTVVVLGERLLLKGYRRLRAGASPELEMGLYLTDVVNFGNCAPVAGVLQYKGKDGEPYLLAMLQAYVTNQGDAWTWSLEYLRRHLEEHRTAPASDSPPANMHAAYLVQIRVLAVRTAELHRALATPTKDSAFDPQPLTRTDLEAYKQRATEEAKNALGLLKTRLNDLTGPDRDKANAVLAAREEILKRIAACTASEPKGTKIRIHGDYHLGQVLLTRNDFILIDFEGEPGHSLEERRAKQSPLRDVAGMLRSFSYVEHSALKSVAHDDVELAKLTPFAREWAAEVRAAFLDAYDAAAHGASLYDALTPGVGLLGLFELEKVLYELRYELGNRPGWAGIPLQGIVEWGIT
jgi:maltose alpha-D-glucosyltransferase/alpha-amylase